MENFDSKIHPFGFHYCPAAIVLVSTLLASIRRLIDAVTVPCREQSAGEPLNFSN
jgi:hypothetical protein